MKGRKPKPSAIHRLNGNPSRKRLDNREPMPTRGRPKCPAFLHPLAKRKWRTLVPELDRLGLLTVVDGAALACFCTCCAEFQIACETLAKEGRTTLGGSGGLKSHPAVAQLHAAMKGVKEFAALFGLDPSSRTRISVPAPAAVNPLSEFLADPVAPPQTSEG